MTTIILVVSVISMTAGSAKCAVDVMGNVKDFDMRSIQTW